MEEVLMTLTKNIEETTKKTQSPYEPKQSCIDWSLRISRDNYILSIDTYSRQVFNLSLDGHGPLGRMSFLFNPSNPRCLSSKFHKVQTLVECGTS
jgi:hypothetical protein